jgi:GAF domain-containing protein
MKLEITLFTDPACPFAFSAEPVRQRLRWHYGEGLDWHRDDIVEPLERLTQASEEPIAIADVSRDPRFARDVAEGTGYVPTSIIVYPLLTGERSLGVLNVLDQSTGAQVGIADMDVLARIAAHAAVVLALVQDARDLERGGGTGAPAARLERALAGADAARREAALEVMSALERLLGAEPR